MPGDVRFRVLGPLTAEDADGPLDLRGPRHRAVLARLLIARGRVVPVRTLVDDLWDDPSEGAVGAVRTFVAALRRGLEPGRPPRAPARLLVTDGPGYALRAAPEAVDAWRFEAAVRAAASPPPAGALPALDEALALWRGPAYAEFADQDWARGEITRLDELRLLAVERRAEALLAAGAAADAVPDLEAHVTGHPWREDAWRLLALALYRAGRQADALTVLRRARATLIADLALDPSPALRRLEADILTQAPHLTPPPHPHTSPNTNASPAADAYPDGDATPGASADPSGTTGPDDGAGPSGAGAGAGRGGGRLVGRGSEVARLMGVADAVAGGTRLRLALISGDAGAGKTALADAVAAGLAARGWTVARGPSPENEGAPATWAWAEVLGALGAPAAEPPAGDEHDPAVARFRTRRAVAAALTSAAREAPVLVVLDDLHRADGDTLALLGSLIADPAAAPVLLLGTYRAAEIPAGLAAALARAAPHDPCRVYLGGLEADAVAELARETAGRPVDAAAARAIHERSGGNPFYVRELARLLGQEGPDALTGVPPGVRDVLRHRLGALPPDARTVLRQAAIIGRDVDLDVLLPLAGDHALDAVDAGLALGFLDEAGPERVRFAHALVRDTLDADVSAPRRARWHTRVAEILQRVRPDDAEAIAHHYLRAGTRATAAPAARYAAAAARRAEARFAPHDAARLWRDAVAAHDRAPDADVPARLEAIMGRVGALALTGGLDAARRHRMDAITAAEELGDPRLTARVIGAFDVPSIWPRGDDPVQARRVAEITERLLAERPAGSDAERCRLLCTLALELRGLPGPRGREAAREAEALARDLGDPHLLAFALDGRFLHTFERAGLAPRRARIGEELLSLARAHDLVTFEVLGHLILVQAHSAVAAFASADVHADAAARLGDRYELPLVSVFTEWYGALKLAAAGRTDAAEAAYRTAAAHLHGTGMPGVEDGLLPLALLGLRVQEGRLDTVDDHADWGPYAPWTVPLTSDDPRLPPESPPDLLLEARLALAALIAVRTGDRAAMTRVHAALRPAAGELAGAASGLLTFGPVTRYLRVLEDAGAATS